MRIAVSVGHTLSGADYGASGYLEESKCTREIGEFVKSGLENQGHEVIYCRIDSAKTVDESLSYRVNKANSANVDLFVEIHLNAGGGKGVETYIYGRGGIAEGYAGNIVNSIADIGYTNRGVKVANFYVLRNTVAPAVLVECCFVDSNEDYNRYDAKEIGNSIVKGITGQEVEDKDELGDGVYIVNSLPYDINARVHKGSYAILDKNGKEIPGRLLEYWDEIVVIEVMPTFKLIEIVYKSYIGLVHGYVTIDAYNNLDFKYIDNYLNDDENTNVFLDAQCENYYEPLLPDANATPLYRGSGEYLHIAYTRLDGTNTSGFVKYEGMQDRRFF